MEQQAFKEIMINNLKELKIEISTEQVEQFYKYMNILIEWNKMINLTAIIEPKEIIIKHFIDSLTIANRVHKNDTIIDIGTGAGFPGIPIKIAYPEIKIVLMDSLNKRINFLDEVIKTLQLANIETIHGRAEEYGRNKKYREKYDVAVARAVAPLNVLLEYLMPFVKVGGKCICMKGSNAEEEILNGKNAIKSLGGKLTKSEMFEIPNTTIKRQIIEIIKETRTDNKYPRKAGTPTKKPL